MGTLNTGTIKVTTIQDAAGADSSTPNQIQQGRAKAWCNFNGTGTPAYRDSFGFNTGTGVIDHGLGDYTVTLSPAMPTANYAVVFGWNSNSVTTVPYFVAIKGTGSAHTDKTTTTLRVIYAGTANISTDAFEINITIFGD